MHGLVKIWQWGARAHGCVFLIAVFGLRPFELGSLRLYGFLLRGGQ
jgi:hypothetical protein